MRGQKYLSPENSSFMSFLITSRYYLIREERVYGTYIILLTEICNKCVLKEYEGFVLQYLRAIANVHP